MFFWPGSIRILAALTAGKRRVGNEQGKAAHLHIFIVIVILCPFYMQWFERGSHSQFSDSMSILQEEHKHDLSGWEGELKESKANLFEKQETERGSPKY